MAVKIGFTGVLRYLRSSLHGDTSYENFHSQESSSDPADSGSEAAVLNGDKEL